MSEQENVQAVEEAFAAFQRGDIPALLDTLTDDVEWFVPGPPDIIPFAGERRGRDQLVQFFTILGEAVEFEQFAPREFIAQGERVVVLGHSRDRVRATGHTVENDWAMVFTLRGGKVAGFRSYEDTAAVVSGFTMPKRTAAAT